MRAGDNPVFLNDLRAADTVKGEESIDPGNGCMIVLRVDLHTPMPELRNFFATVISKKRHEQGIRGPRATQFKADPWRVWDGMQVPRKHRSLGVARDLFGVRGHPKTHEKAKRAVERINRAYAKAQCLIEEVGRSRNPNITERAVEAALLKGIQSLKEALSTSYPDSP
jgi:hypothetical protein